MNSTAQTNENEFYALERVAERLRIPPAGRALCTGWNEALRGEPAAAQAFLQPAFIEQSGRDVALTDDMIRALVAFAGRIAADEDVFTFFRYCRFRVLYDKTLVQSWEEQWPPLDEYLGKDAGLLNALVMLSTVPEMLANYQRLNIPDAIRRDTVADLKRWMETDLYYHRYHCYGITPWIARWLCKHWQARVLQLGRLQFARDRFGLPLRAYRRRGGRELVVLPEAGQRFNDRGHVQGECCAPEPDVWTSTLEDGSGFVAGQTITGDGTAHRETIRLELRDWELVLRQGDDMLGINIPAGGPLTHKACGESLQRALESFPAFFPEFKFKGFWIKSWLLDPRFDGMLPPDANIVRLQRELFLFPGIQGDNEQIYNRVFGWGVTDLAHAPRKSSLQQAVAAYLEKGGHFHGGYAFLLKDDFNWGGQVYRWMMPPGPSA